MDVPDNTPILLESKVLMQLSEQYPAWCCTSELHNDGNDESTVPVTFQELHNIFHDLKEKFGFQKSSMENIYHHLLAQLDSRASRMTPLMALISLHSSYVGGEQANYKKWYFSCQLDLDEELGFNNIELHGKSNKRNKKLAKKRGVHLQKQWQMLSEREKTYVESHRKVEIDDELKNSSLLSSPSNCKNIKSACVNALKIADYKWKNKMKALSCNEMARQIALYLLCWGEANNIRFTPECLCFIFKCSLDYDTHTIGNSPQIAAGEGEYLDNVITPIYNFLKKQRYTSKNAQAQLVKNSKDHQHVIGYDDVNQLFWYPEGIERIVLQNGERLVDKPLHQRYTFFKDIEWFKVFYKTYREKRSWLHCCTNFNRIWIIHFTSFWYFTSFNAPTLYTPNYEQMVNNGPILQVRLTIMSIAGAIACFVQLLATVLELEFVPREWPGAQYLFKRLFGLLLLFAINFAPTVYILGWYRWNEVSFVCEIISIIQLVISIATSVFFSIRPLGGLFQSYLKRGKYKRRYVSSKAFTASFPKLHGPSKWFSHGLWISVFVCKFVESYFFLTLSLRDPIRVLSIMDMSRCHGDWFISRNVICNLQPKVTLFLMIFTDLILFFLDTYLWYIICNCIFSIGLSFSLGTSILSPWKNIYSRLPKRIYSKILASNQMDVQYKPKVLVSQIWNAIVVSFHREHLLDIDHVKKLLYQQAESSENGEQFSLKSPSFFVAEDDSTFKSTEFFSKNSEAQRRVSFFAQSLSTPIAEPIPVECMPSFTVLVPHYSERILLSLTEIIRQTDANTKLTLLEYLKYLYIDDWDCFVQDTKALAHELGYLNANASLGSDMHLQSSINDLPFYSIGFNTSNKQFIMRTCIWASLRSQTLYRTISGFQNYAKAIKLLYRVENPFMVQMFGEDSEALDLELNSMADRKFKMVIAMQRYCKFSETELQATEFLLRAYPHMKISYLEEKENSTSNETEYYSCLIDGSCETKNSKRTPMYRIKLSGNPILGDGKSDNQNHSIVFYRGEYIQVIDANQDNYLEECLKIRSVLSEFDELDIGNDLPYIPGIEYTEPEAPVAIIGAREYIFSENIGVLGDIAAGKEQTFGTLFARTLAEIGGKLHYGHPDFLNAIFMTTRGGVSKSQKGLHLNEDIYAGMSAICRGGRIKHSDYYQCGKGRDLGFGSILNFTNKIGAGMGEQLLSREYYYLGTQLPLDRFLSFFYAHPGFHLNNLFISLSVQLFFILLLNLGSMNHEMIICEYDKNVPITDLELPLGCYNLEPVLHWVTIFVLSIFIVFFISFCPLLIQEVLERGLWKALSRFVHHLVSFAPIFEVFVCQMYSNSLIADITFGSAKYISTGRGFAITRVGFSSLYSKFTTCSIYTGSKVFLMLLFSMVSMWQPALLWFVITLLSLTMAPFFFNPHQFSFQDFFVDYKTVMVWFFGGNGEFQNESWVNYTKVLRVRYCGLKRKMISHASEKQTIDSSMVAKSNLMFTEIVVPSCVCLFNLSAYYFINSQTGVANAEPTMASARLVLVTLFPILINMVLVFIAFVVSLIFGPFLSFLSPRFSNGIAGATHLLSVFVYLLTFELIFILHNLNFTRSLVLIITVINVQQLLFRLVSLLLISKEFKNNRSNTAWWSGKWYTTGMGWSTIGQPFREYIVKVMESSYFAADFVLTHTLLLAQTPLVFVPWADTVHSMFLYWLKPKQLVFKKVDFNKSASRARKSTFRTYFVLFFINTSLLVSLFLLPVVMKRHGFAGFAQSTLNEMTIARSVNASLIFQPVHQNNNDTGPAAPTAFLLRKPEPVETLPKQ